MSGYFGTQTQKHLQAQAEASAGFIQSTPGACQTGRNMGCDDPDRLGWDQVKEFIDRDGVCGFRLIPLAQANNLRSRLIEQECRLDTWDVFLADGATALAASETILARGLPEGLTELDGPTDPESKYTGSIQALMAAAGVVPFSGSLLTGGFGPVTTVAIGDDKPECRSSCAWLYAAQRLQRLSSICLGWACCRVRVAARQGPRHLHQRPLDRECVSRSQADAHLRACLEDEHPIAQDGRILRVSSGAGPCLRGRHAE